MLHMGNFTQGGETNISLKINFKSKQPTSMYQLRFSRGPHDHFQDFHLLNLSKTLGELPFEVGAFQEKQETIN